MTLEGKPARSQQANSEIVKLRSRVADMEQRIRAGFLSISGVSSVDVCPGEDDGLRVEIHLSDFGRASRRKVYAKERMFYKEFPDSLFDFDVIDASQDGINE